MSEQVNKEQTKESKQEKVNELTDDQLGEAVGGLAIDAANEPSRLHPDFSESKRSTVHEGELNPHDEKAFEDTTRSLGSG